MSKALEIGALPPPDLAGLDRSVASPSARIMMRAREARARGESLLRELSNDELAQLGMRRDDTGKWWIYDPRPAPEPIPVGTVSHCEVRVQLRLVARAYRAYLVPAETCEWCRNARGWTHCAEHELASRLDAAAGCVTEYGRVWDWAWALGYHYAPSKYVHESCEFAGQYARAVTDAL